MKNIMCKNMDKINIFILIDALGWNYIKNRQFLDDIAVLKWSVKSILGYSCGIIPSIFTGKFPSQHRKFTLFYYSPQTSPFRWIKYFLWFPDGILESRLFRKMAEIISKNIYGYKGYFETYLVPVYLLPFLDLRERSNDYDEGAFGETENIFDVWKKRKIPYRRYYYNLSDEEIFRRAERDISQEKAHNYFLYLSQLDHYLHFHCQEEIEYKLRWYEDNIRKIYTFVSGRYKEVRLCVFSDHGMTPVTQTFDLKKGIDTLGFKMPKDYVVLYDSTMARFWFFNDKAGENIIDYLRGISCGRLLSNCEAKQLGIDFENDMYGQEIFLMNPGTIILPSFMGNKPLQGMHGFSPDDSWTDACFISNYRPDVEIHDVRDLFKVMSETKKKIKVLYFLNSVVRAGVEEHVLGLLQQLDRTKFEPILVCPKELIDLMRADLENIKIKYYPVCIRRWRHKGEIKKFLRILKEERPDIVHSHLFFATRFVAPLSKLIGIPLVIETAHLREAWRRGIKKMYAIDRFFYRFVDKIVTVSEAVKKYLSEDKKISESKIEVIYNGVDLDKFKSVPKQSNNGQFAIGVIGRLEPQKGHKYFLEAVSLLDDRFNDVNFLIVGEGSLKEELYKYCKDLGIEQRVRFLGYREDIVSVIAEMDLVILPSLYEGFPLVILEAQAMGKSVVATNVDGIPEAVINNKTGLIVPPKDSQALKSAIEIFLNNRELGIKMGCAGRKNIEENFDMKKQIEQIQELYKNLLKEVN